MYPYGNGGCQRVKVQLGCALGRLEASALWYGKVRVKSWSLVYVAAVDGICLLKERICYDALVRPVWAREHCRISPPRFLAKCRRRRLNQTSFVLLCFVLFTFSEF